MLIYLLESRVICPHRLWFACGDARRRGRCYVGGLNFLSFRVEPVLTVSVIVGERGPTVSLLETEVCCPDPRQSRQCTWDHASGATSRAAATASFLTVCTAAHVLHSGVPLARTRQPAFEVLIVILAGAC